MTRQATNKLLEMMEEGIIKPDTIVQACLSYMSEDEVADMCDINEFFYCEEAEEDEDEEDED